MSSRLTPSFFAAAVTADLRFGCLATIGIGKQSRQVRSGGIQQMQDQDGLGVADTRALRLRVPGFACLRLRAQGAGERELLTTERTAAGVVALVSADRLVQERRPTSVMVTMRGRLVHGTM